MKSPEPSPVKRAASAIGSVSAGGEAEDEDAGAGVAKSQERDDPSRSGLGRRGVWSRRYRDSRFGGREQRSQVMMDW